MKPNKTKPKQPQPQAMNRSEKRIKELEEWIDREGEVNNTCTYPILERICSNCRCWRSTKKCKRCHGTGRVNVLVVSASRNGNPTTKIELCPECGRKP